MDASPLGSGALAATTFPLDREAVAIHAQAQLLPRHAGQREARLAAGAVIGAMKALAGGDLSTGVPGVGRKDEIGLKDTLLGDGLVPLRSALGEHEDPGRSLEIPASRKWAGYGLGHFDLLDNREVYERIREWVIGL